MATAAAAATAPKTKTNAPGKDLGVERRRGDGSGPLQADARGVALAEQGAEPDEELCLRVCRVWIGF